RAPTADPMAPSALEASRLIVVAAGHDVRRRTACIGGRARQRVISLHGLRLLDQLDADDHRVVAIARHAAAARGQVSKILSECIRHAPVPSCGGLKTAGPKIEGFKL